MELVVMIGIIFFFGAVILSTVTQRGSAPAPVIFVRAEPLERLQGSDAGLSLVILLLVIGIAVWVL